MALRTADLLPTLPLTGKHDAENSRHVESIKQKMFRKCRKLMTINEIKLCSFFRKAALPAFFLGYGGAIIQAFHPLFFFTPSPDNHSESVAQKKKWIR